MNTALVNDTYIEKGQSYTISKNPFVIVSQIEFKNDLFF